MKHRNKIVYRWLLILSLPLAAQGWLPCGTRRGILPLDYSQFSATPEVTADSNSKDREVLLEGNVTILDQSPHHLVVAKPPSVVCHHSDWTGSRTRQEVPMIQRVRIAVGRKVNLVHRLDRGASGCLLMSYTDDGDSTSQLIGAMNMQASKTYVALVRGEGVLRGVDFKEQGWFCVDRPIKDEGGKLNNATTYFRFVAGQDGGDGTRPRASLVLARPVTGRWHQIRRHLNGLSHPILGDSSHGVSKVNQEWRRERGLAGERICLHLLELMLPPTDYTPEGIHATCPIADDMMELLEKHLPDVLEQAETILLKEGISLRPTPLQSANEKLPDRKSVV